MNRFAKWINLALVLAALAFGFLLHQMLTQVWDVFRLPVVSSLPMPLPTLLAILVAALVFLLIRTSAKTMVFLKEVSVELSKVTWPNQQETIASTGIVIVMLGIAAVIMFLFDTLWGTLTRNFLAL